MNSDLSSRHLFQTKTNNLFLSINIHLLLYHFFHLSKLSSDFELTSFEYCISHTINHNSKIQVTVSDSKPHPKMNRVSMIIWQERGLKKKRDKNETGIGAELCCIVWAISGDNESAVLMIVTFIARRGAARTVSATWWMRDAVPLGRTSFACENTSALRGASDLSSPSSLTVDHNFFLSFSTARSRHYFVQLIDIINDYNYPRFRGISPKWKWTAFHK